MPWSLIPDKRGTAEEGGDLAIASHYFRHYFSMWGPSELAHRGTPQKRRGLGNTHDS